MSSTRLIDSAWGRKRLNQLQKLADKMDVFTTHGLFIRWNPPSDLVFSISEPTNLVYSRDTLRNHQHQHAAWFNAIKGEILRPKSAPNTNLNSIQRSTRGALSHSAHPSAIDKRICLPCLPLYDLINHGCSQSTRSSGSPHSNEEPSRRALVHFAPTHSRTAVLLHETYQGDTLATVDSCHQHAAAVWVRARPSVECYDYNLNGNNNTRPRPSSTTVLFRSSTTSCCCSCVLELSSLSFVTRCTSESSTT